MFYIKVCRRLDSNRGTLVSEATTLPTEPQARRDTVRCIHKLEKSFDDELNDTDRQNR